MFLQVGGGFIHTRFFHGMFIVAGPRGIDEAGEVPGGPAAGALLVGARTFDPSRHVLIVHARIADERFRAGVSHYPA